MSSVFKIDHLHSVDLKCNKVSEYTPEDRKCVFFQMYFDVINKKTGEEREYQLSVATPSGLNDVGGLTGSNLLSDRALLVYKTYDYNELVNDIASIVDECSKNVDTDTALRKLERYFISEYEE